MEQHIKTYSQYLNEDVKLGVQHEGEMWNVYGKHPKTGRSALIKTCIDRKEARLFWNNYKANLKKAKTK